jgi:hypothetical protein
MTDPRADVQRLHELHRLETEEQVGEYLDIIDRLAEGPRDPALLDDLLLAMCDDTDDQSTMRELLQLVEDYPREQFAQALVRVASMMLAHARSWAERLHSRLINSAAHVPAYRAALARATPEQRAAVGQLLRQIRMERPQVADVIASLGLPEVGDE